MKLRLLVSGTAPELFPSVTYFGLIFCEDDIVEIPQKRPFKGGWGKSLDIALYEQDEYGVPEGVQIVWLSLVERKFYYLEEFLNQPLLLKLMEPDIEPAENHLVVGMAPYGGLAVWLSGARKSVLINWFHGEETELDISEFLPMNPDISIGQYCDFYINNDSLVRNHLMKNGLPPQDLYDNNMRQYCYRYVPIFKKWKEADAGDKGKEEWMEYNEGEIVPAFVYIEESLFDGTYDKLHEDGLLQHHTAGRPQKLSLKWLVKKSEFVAYFWFDEDRMYNIFDRFYGAHPETKSDFLIHVDYEQKKFRLSLYRYGLKAPLVIDEDAYQHIVFKNQFEYFRSGNYNQVNGAWVW